MSFEPKTIEEASKHRYAEWAGNPKGIKYNEKKCMEIVCISHLSYQCDKDIWKDGFCKKHHPVLSRQKNVLKIRNGKPSQLY